MNAIKPLEKTMNTATNNTEHLEKATHSLEFALGDLQQANAKASAMESLLLLEIIGLAVQSLHKLRALQSAKREGARPCQY